MWGTGSPPLGTAVRYLTINFVIRPQQEQHGAADCGVAVRQRRVRLQRAVKRLLGDFAATMSPEILEMYMYVFVHYNWQYEFMRPSIAEIVEAYLKIYGPEARVEDLEDESDSEMVMAATMRQRRRAMALRQPPRQPPLSERASRRRTSRGCERHKLRPQTH